MPDLAPLTLSNPPGLFDPAPYGYSHVAEVAAGSKLLFIAGQGGESLDSSISPDFQLQAGQALANLRTALASVGADYCHVAKLTVLVVDHDHERLAIWSDTLREAWGGEMTPACTLIPVPRLALDGMLIEVDAVAVVPQ
jgi:enamine deaminase RidA (YjgF/YER057c/UK114 family)